MKIKYGKIIVSILLVVCIACLCSCDKISTSIFNPDRITEFYFVSCTDPGNTFYLNEKKNDVKSVKLLRQDEAVVLAHEVETIPDAESTEGMCSYIIRINYVEGGIEKSVEKTGYNTFPENWDRVIELTNIILGKYRHVTNSRELAVIDAEYLRSHSWMPNESIIPEGMTLDEIIEDADINYLTLFEPQYNSSAFKERLIEEAINDYLFECFDLTSHQIYELNENPPKSSADEMKKIEEILSHYSQKQQTIKAIEELAELQKELAKMLNNQGDIDALISEIADVYIMTAQIMILYGIDSEELNREVAYKLNRQLGRIMEESNEE